MPGVETIKSSWADEVELDYGGLPPTTEAVENGHKYVTEYKYNKDDKKTKVVRTYKISKQVVPKTVAKRRTWSKFVLNSKEDEKANDPLLDPTKNIAKCRICNGEHWSVNCPYKGTAMDTNLMEKKAAAAASAAVDAPKSGKYVPPFLKDSQKGGLGMRGRDDTAAIRISNLSESMTEVDLEELVKKIGPQSKMYLARDKNTGLCKGFAYVHFKQRKDAAAAIEILNGHGYDHLILSVEWSKPQNN
ncbi:GH17624 [Drosophila grimshawi]|uniref:Eukaryotic translation initiation factor 3 subunit G n=1 Tax=Drosophila grimshawi TaxID=7222 RepID=B4JX67_DROGR|nr:GH17624 [Drosophila grimshawi]